MGKKINSEVCENEWELIRNVCVSVCECVFAPQRPKAASSQKQSEL